MQAQIKVQKPGGVFLYSLPAVGRSLSRETLNGIGLVSLHHMLSHLVFPVVEGGASGFPWKGQGGLCFIV